MFIFFFSDRTGGGKFCEEYELATAKLEEFSEMLKREQQERLDIIKVLEDGEAFYDTSYGEVKVIVNVSVRVLARLKLVCMSAAGGGGGGRLLLFILSLFGCT